MQRTPHVSKSFKEENVPQKIVFGERVITSMTANTGLFASPKVPLTTLNADNDALKAAAAAAESGSHLDRLQLNATEKAWNIAFDLQAEYVDGVANGNAAIIEKSGFNATKSEIVPVSAPGDVTIKSIKSTGHEGHLRAEVAKTLNAKGYLLVISSDGTLPTIDKGLFKLSKNPKVVAFFLDDHTKMDVSGLDEGPCFVSIAAYNHKGFGPFSRPVSVKVL